MCVFDRCRVVRFFALMSQSLNHFQIAVFFCFVLFWANLAAAIAGHRFGRRQFLAHPDGLAGGSGNVDAVILSLLGLLTAFTFSAAYSRYETRRQLVVNEVNALGTAWMRLDLLPEDSQPKIRSLFHEYVESRARIWPAMSESKSALREIEAGVKQQGVIWSNVVAATNAETHGDARKLILPALNEVFDISTTRLVAVQAHPPLPIYLMLAVFSLAAACLTGHSMAKAERPLYPQLAGFSALACLVLILIADIEYPRFGFVRLDTPHQLLRDLAEQTAPLAAE